MPTRWPGFDSRMTHVSSFGSRTPERASNAWRTYPSDLTVAQLVERGTVNDTAVIPRSMVRIRPVRYNLAEWPSGLRRWFKAPVSPEARVRISLQSSLLAGADRGGCPSKPVARAELPTTQHSEVAQRKRVGLITQRSEDRNLPSLPFCPIKHPVRRFGRVVKALAC